MSLHRLNFARACCRGRGPPWFGSIRSSDFGVKAAINCTAALWVQGRPRARKTRCGLSHCMSMQCRGKNTLEPRLAYCLCAPNSSAFIPAGSSMPPRTCDTSLLNIVFRSRDFQVCRPESSALVCLRPLGSAPRLPLPAETSNHAYATVVALPYQSRVATAKQQS